MKKLFNYSSKALKVMYRLIQSVLCYLEPFPLRLALLNTNDTLWCCHSVHTMNAVFVPSGCQPSDQADLGCESTCMLLSSTPTVAIVSQKARFSRQGEQNY